MSRAPSTRRSVLLGLGGLASLGLLAPARKPPTRLAVRIWVSERAAAYPGVADRAAGIVARALASAGAAATVTTGDRPVALDDDDPRSWRETWPRTVLGAVTGLGAVDPVRDVNLLVTDGDPTGRTAGYAVPHIAAIAGARHLAAVDPAVRSRRVVDYSVPAAIAQLLLHECGHALGLGHDHGTIAIDGDTVTASPMVSGYAWAPSPVRRRQLGIGTSACGEPLASAADRRRRLSLRFADCAAAAIRQYRRGLLPPGV